jgi:Uma2 family endonuclease
VLIAYRISFNILKEIDRALENTNCRFYSGNVKVNYEDKFYYYPDAFVTCDPRDRADHYIKRHPKLIAEVLSQSTRVFDLGQKFEDYRQIPNDSIGCHDRRSKLHQP